MKDNINKTFYLLYVFCNNDYERTEMEKWIDDKGVNFVYDYVERNFKNETKNRSKNKGDNVHA